MLGRIPVYNGLAVPRNSHIIATGARDTRTRRLVFLNRIAQEDLIQTEELISSDPEIHLNPTETERSEQHPSLPFTPAFNVGDIVYGTITFSNDKGARADILYHQGLVG